MPPAKKRRWRAFVRKIQTVAEKELGSRTVVFNHQFPLEQVVSGRQLIAGFSLYSQRASSGVFGDLFKIVGFENDGNSTAVHGETVDDSTKFMFHSGVYDMTIRNDSTYNQVGSKVPSSDAKLELDIYELSMSKTASDSSFTYNSIAGVLEDGQLTSKVIGGVGNQIELGSRGATPWDMVTALSKFGIRIWKKTKFFIPNGDTITYQIRDPRRHVFQKAQLDESLGINYPGVTRHLLVIAKLVPGLPVGNEPSSYQEKIVVGVTRKYFYKVEGMNDSRDRYVVT